MIKMLFFKGLISYSLQTELSDGLIGKKPAPGDHNSSLKIFLARCPCAYYYLNTRPNHKTFRP